MPRSLIPSWTSLSPSVFPVVSVSKKRVLTRSACHGFGFFRNRLVLLLELHCRFGGRDGPAHDEEPGDGEGDEVVDDHREERRPFEDLAVHLADAEDVEERGCEGNSDVVDKSRESGGRIGARELEEEAQHEQRFENAEDVPDDLNAAI